MSIRYEGRNNPRIRLVSLSCMAFAIVFILWDIMSQAQEGVIVSFTVPEHYVTLHEPIFIELSVHNGLMEEIRFDVGHNRKSKIEFTITEPDGFIVQVPRLSEEGLGLIGRISLGPKEMYTQKLLLNEWYQFTKLGDYTVEAKLSNAIQTQSGKSLQPRLSEVMSLQIRPRNAERLKQVSQILAQSAVGLSTVTEAMEAANALSYIRDPIAVPYLQKLLKEGKFVQHYGVAGLGRIANDEAIEILISALSDQDSDLVSLVRFTLTEMKRKVKDPKLREKIEMALRS